MDTHTIPHEMANAQRWVNWTPSKVPVCPVTRRNASSTNPKTWTTLTKALANNPRIGFMLGAGFACIDLDDAITENGNLTPGAAELVANYPQNLIEVSPSGRGLHIWGTAPEKHGLKTTFKGQQVEFYSRARYITWTGELFQDGFLLPL